MSARMGIMAEESDTHHLLQLVEAEHQMGEDADAVLRLGAMIMAAGTGGYRVIRAMKRAARALGFDRVEAVISVNNITCSFHKGELFRTIVVNRDNPAVDASRIEALENLSHHMGSSYTAEELHRELDQIEQRVGKRWPVWVQALAAGLACSGFAVLNHYPFLEAVVVALAAAVGQIVRHSCARRHLNQLGTTAMAAVVASLMYLFMAKGLAMVGIIDSPTFTTGYVASVLFLIPGFPLFSSLLDLSRFDLFSGLSRLCYATTVICTATMAATAVSLITGLQPLPPDPQRRISCGTWRPPGRRLLVSPGSLFCSILPAAWRLPLPRSARSLTWCVSCAPRPGYSPSLRRLSGLWWWACLVRF